MQPEQKPDLTESKPDGELTDKELDQASGGIIAILIGLDRKQETTARPETGAGGGPH